MAFIGYNFPGTGANAALNDYQTSPLSVACLAPNNAIFKNANNNNYIRFDAYGSGNNKFYGYVFACQLADVLIPEMILVRDKYMGYPGKVWLPLTTF